MITVATVSLPTPSTRMVNAPVELIVPPMTDAPGIFSTGIDSPVIIDSSTAEMPSITTPSTGMLSPGLTRTRSPTFRNSTSTSLALAAPAAAMRWATFGERCISPRMASEACDLARDSSHRPIRINAMTTADVSK